MASDIDQYIVATFALWAGDFEYFENLLREFTAAQVGHSLDERIARPEDVILATGRLRLRQLWQKRGEFRKLAAEYSNQGADISDVPLSIETNHLRAAVWRTGEREFLMQGYLKVLSWQKHLFERAWSEAHRHKPVQTDAPKVGSELFPTQFPGEAKEPLGVAWAVPGNPFMQVELTDMGLLEASVLWTSPELPADAEAIKGPLLRVLRTLDPELAEAPF